LLCEFASLADLPAAEERCKQASGRVWDARNKESPRAPDD